MQSLPKRHRPVNKDGERGRQGDSLSLWERARVRAQSVPDKEPSPALRAASPKGRGTSPRPYLASYALSSSCTVWMTCTGIASFLTPAESCIMQAGHPVARKPALVREAFPIFRLRTC